MLQAVRLQKVNKIKANLINFIFSPFFKFGCVICELRFLVAELSGD